MVRGWRRAFCTSIPKEDDTKIFSDKHHRHHHQHQQRERPQIPEQLNFHGGGTGAGSCGGSNNSPRISSKFGFFSNPSTPRPQSQPVSSPSLRCRTTATSASSVPSSPRLHCKTAPAVPKKSSSNSSSRLFSLSNPSSPRSPSSFSLLKASLRLSRTRCGICIQSVKTGQGTAIFTAECSHTFHFPCIAAHVKKHQILVCPVCSTSWKEIPLLDAHTNTIDETESKTNAKAKSLRVYDDDESLLSPSSISGFNPIPESDESNEDQQMVEEEVEFQGFCVSSSASSMNKSPREEKNVRSVDVSLLPESAVISVHRSYGTCAVILKVKAPPQTLAMTKSSPRAPVDLVTVLDVGASMNGDKLLMMKRAMRSLICLLGEMDRLSIVAFSATSKRLLPFKRMTMAGRRSARRIVDAIGCTGQAAVVNDALKKAAKILEDRRERNPVGTIMLMSDGEDQRVHANACKLKRNSPVVSSTRFGNIPVHAIGFCNVAEGAFAHAVHEDAFVRCLGGLLSVVVQELKLQLGFMSGSDPAEITAVYSLMGRPEALGSGLIRVGDLYAEEERDLLVELRVPSFCGGSRHVMSVGSSFRDPITRDLVYSREQPIHVPRPQTVRSQTESLQRLKNLHVTARAIAESRRLMERSDLSGAYHLLSSARALLVQAGSASANEFLRCLEAELAELQRFRQKAQRATAPDRREATGRVEEKAEPLTPTSAWRAAERLAKVAIMRKSMNRVSDLHGFENARF